MAEDLWKSCRTGSEKERNKRNKMRKRTLERGKGLRLLLLLGALFFAACTKEEAVYELASGSSAVSGEEEKETPADAAGTDGAEAEGGGLTQPVQEQMGGQEPSPASVNDRIYIYICGAVAAPGVYPMAPGSRVYELIEAAGGLLAEADERQLNQAGLLEDGQQITVYTKEETAAGLQGDFPGAIDAEESGSGEKGETRGRVNLNTAGEEELMTLNGIGEARAKAILKYREENGGFRSIEEIMNIEGIKEKLFEKIKDEIEV